MPFAIEPEDLERFAIPIGIGIAALVVLIFPSVRRSLMECFRAGKEHGERLSGKKPKDDADRQPNDH